MHWMAATSDGRVKLPAGQKTASSRTFFGGPPVRRGGGGVRRRQRRGSDGHFPPTRWSHLGAFCSPYSLTRKPSNQSRKRPSAASPDGRQIVSGNNDGTVNVIDATPGQKTLTLKGHSGPVFGVAFSPDGKRIVSGSRDNAVKVWDAAAGQETLTLRGHRDQVNCVAFSLDGRRIVSGSGTAC